MPLVPRANACSMMNSTKPLSPAWVARNRAVAAAVQQMVAAAQAKTNTILVRSPWDYSDFGLNVMADVYRSNLSNGSPGVVPPGSVIPSSTPGGSGAPKPGAAVAGGAGAMRTPAGSANQGWWSGWHPGVIPGGAGSGPGGLLSLTGLPPNPRRLSGARTAATGSHGSGGATGSAVIPDWGPGGGTMGANALRGATGASQVHIPKSDVGVAKRGFVGRGEVDCEAAPGVTQEVVSASANPPAPPLTITPISPPVVLAKPTSAGLSGAYPVTCNPDATGDESAAAGISPWWWLLLAGVLVYAASDSDDRRPRRAA